MGPWRLSDTELQRAEFNAEHTHRIPLEETLPYNYFTSNIKEVGLILTVFVLIYNNNQSKSSQSFNILFILSGMLTKKSCGLRIIVSRY